MRLEEETCSYLHGPDVWDGVCECCGYKIRSSNYLRWWREQRLSAPSLFPELPKYDNGTTRGRSHNKGEQQTRERERVTLFGGIKTLWSALRLSLSLSLSLSLLACTSSSPSFGSNLHFLSKYSEILRMYYSPKQTMHSLYEYDIMQLSSLDCILSPPPQY